MHEHIGNAITSKRLEGFIPNPKLKLLEQASEVMRFFRTEVDRVLAGMSGTHRLMSKLLYGTGIPAESNFSGFS